MVLRQETFELLPALTQSDVETIEVAAPTEPPSKVESPVPPRIKITLPAADNASVNENYVRLYYPEDASELLPIVERIRERAEQHPSAHGETERLCVEITRFVTASMALGAPERLECASTTLANALSSCGGYAMVMCELARVAGLPSRYLGLFGIPSTGSHALVEVHYDGDWHLYDPTFGVFFYSSPRWDGSGHVLSASDIITWRERPTMMQVVHKPWGLDYTQQLDFAVQPLLDPPTSHVLTYWGEGGRRSMFPVAFGNDATVSVPLDIDLRDRDVFSLGTRTGQWLDTWLKCIDDPRNGYFFLGGTCPTIFHCVRIKVRESCRLTVRYVATADSVGSLGVFPLAGCILLNSEVKDLETTFHLFLNSVEPSFLLMAEQNFWIDMTEYRLESDDGSVRAETRRSPASVTLC